MFEKLKEGHRDWNMQVSKRPQKALGEVKRQPGKNKLRPMLRCFYFPRIIIGAIWGCSLENILESDKLRSHKSS